jgi:hypothetical protein
MENIREKDEQNRDLRREFDDIFDEKLRKQIPHYKAYEEAERDFQSKYNHKKYASFESYRVSRSERIKKRKR